MSDARTARNRSTVANNFAQDGNKSPARVCALHVLCGVTHKTCGDRTLYEVHACKIKIRRRYRTALTYEESCFLKSNSEGPSRCARPSLSVSQEGTGPRSTFFRGQLQRGEVQRS